MLLQDQAHREEEEADLRHELWKFARDPFDCLRMRSDLAVPVGTRKCLASPRPRSDSTAKTLRIIHKGSSTS